MLTEECKKDLKEYCELNGYGGDYMDIIDLFFGNHISRFWFYESCKGRGKELRKKWTGNDLKIYDMHLLNFIKPILLKHNINNIGITRTGLGIKDLYIYMSTTWEYDDIKRT